MSYDDPIGSAALSLPCLEWTAAVLPELTIQGALIALGGVGIESAQAVLETGKMLMLDHKLPRRVFRQRRREQVTLDHVDAGRMTNGRLAVRFNPLKHHQLTDRMG